MDNQITQSQKQVIVPNNLTSAVKELNGSLSLIKPNNSETTQIITYALLAVTIVGIFVYHYIKSHETQETN